MLYLTGYPMTLEDIKNFRQLGSHCPGHPEYRHTVGVETTTGPLGQGCGNSVGMAMAARFLGKQFNRAEFPLPALLVLDLKMPRMDGFEVLRWIREQPELKVLRVLVLTASADMRDVNLAYELGANSFLVKPLNFESFIQICKFVTNYWLHTDRAPAVTPPPKSKRVSN